jgi:hypothetical protein
MSSTSVIKNFIVKRSHTLLPNNFIISRGKRYIHVISVHLNSENPIFGYTLHSNLNHDYFDDSDDSYTCFVNEFLLPKRFSFKDSQQYYIDFRIKNVYGDTINLDEIVDKNNGDVVDIPIEQFDPTIHRFRYKVRIELQLEIVDE